MGRILAVAVLVWCIPTFAAADTQTPSSPTAISLTTIGSAYTQDFDSLATSATSSTLPGGWAFSEGGSNANSTYAAGTGSSGHW